MRALAALTLLIVVGSLSAGCRPEDDQQRAARIAAESWASQRPDYNGEAHCTDAAAQGYIIPIFTEQFLCAVERGNGDCDWVAVGFRQGSPLAKIELYRERGGCTLPA